MVFEIPIRPLLNAGWIVLIILLPGRAFSFQQDDREAPPDERKSRHSFSYGEKTIELSKDLTLSTLFEELGDPEGIARVNTPFVIYGWTLAESNSSSLIVEANPKDNSVADWVIAQVKEGEVVSTVSYSQPSKSRPRYMKWLPEMRRARAQPNPPIFPGGLWCTTFNRSIGHGHPFEILDEHDLVGPSLWVNVHNVGVEPVETWQVTLTVETPSGEIYSEIVGEVEERWSKTVNPGELRQVSVPFFFWVNKDMPKDKMLPGRYQYYAEFGNARSEVHEVVVHRRSFAIPSPNDADLEIVITPFYDKLPIYGLKYEALVKECERTFSKPYEGDPSKVKISAFEFMKYPVNEYTTGVRKLEASYPLGDFGTIEVRERRDK